MAVRQSQRPKQPVLTVLVAVGLLVGARAVQLAVCDLNQPRESPVASSRSEPARAHSVGAGIGSRDYPGANASGSPAADLAQDHELRAMLSAACPHALEYFEQDIHGQPEKPRVDPPEYRVAFLPGVKLPPLGARLAQRSGDWLVPPDQWYAPEDLPKGEGG
ncbi:MAG: hypothetical protein KDA37_11470, partial [Planctomycetales bacterium]|nr:hypothetical protein [Planctomycetales bacterium]